MRGQRCEGSAMSRTWRLRPVRIVTFITVAALALVVFRLFTVSAHAQIATNEMQSIVTTSVTSGAGSCTGGGCVSSGVAQIKQNQFRKTLTIDNTGNAVAVAFCFGTCTALIGAGGTQYLAAGTVAFWPFSSAPSAAITFISASTTPPVTVREGQ